MVSSASATPSFGKADLSNCERELIHLPGSIQPHGVLLQVRESDFVVVLASINTRECLGLDRDPVGQRLDWIDPDLAAGVRSHIDDALQTVPAVVRCNIGGRVYDGLLHRPPDGGLIVELEPAGPVHDLSQMVERALQTIVGAPSLRVLGEAAVALVGDLTGYDRVMFYRFDDAGNGEVLAEQRRPDMEPLLGNRYPASDIPRVARRLYERNRLRVLADITYTPVPLSAALSPLSGRPLDMSMCALRSVSPIHVQYLRNMGVRATLVVSLMVGDTLWGLLSCHHEQPRTVSFEVRAVCELLAEVVATRIAALQSFSEGQAELAVRRLEQRMVEAISRDGDWRVALFDGTQALLQPLGASGAALLYDGMIQTVGDVPGTPQLREIGAWLDAQPRAPVIATGAFTVDAPQFAALVGVAAGLVATPVSRAPGEYLVWFRPEQIRTVAWGGNPYVSVTAGGDPADLSPRRSFAKWHELVERTCEPWTQSDLTTVRLIGETVSDVVLQFRSVRMLIAQDQLEQIGRQVRLSEQPVVVTDAVGCILLTNESFARLLPPDRAPPERLEDLLAYVAEPEDARRRLWDLLRHRRTWRGEVQFAGRSQERPMLVRADPVFSSPERVLGFVLLFTDLTERKAADSARRRFQDGITEGHRMSSGRLDAKGGMVFQTLLATVLENAQLAALEITDGVEITRMPELLESVQNSVQRATEVLETLILHTRRGGGVG